MIDIALDMVAKRLNGHLAARLQTSDEMVSLTPLADGEGKPAASARDRLAMFVTNISEDAALRASYMPQRDATAGAGVLKTQPLRLDIYFMLASGFEAERYKDGLTLLSAGVSYLRANSMLTPQNCPEMPDGIEQLSIEISNLPSEEMGQLWGNLGGRYVPSVHYKMRTVTLTGDISGVAPLIEETELAG